MQVEQLEAQKNESVMREIGRLLVAVVHAQAERDAAIARVGELEAELAKLKPDPL